MDSFSVTTRKAIVKFPRKKPTCIGPVCIFDIAIATTIAIKLAYVKLNWFPNIGPFHSVS